MGKEREISRGDQLAAPKQTAPETGLGRNLRELAGPTTLFTAGEMEVQRWVAALGGNKAPVFGSSSSVLSPVPGVCERAHMHVWPKQGHPSLHPSIIQAAHDVGMN